MITSYRDAVDFQLQELSGTVLLARLSHAHSLFHVQTWHSFVHLIFIFLCVMPGHTGTYSQRGLDDTP